MLLRTDVIIVVALTRLDIAGVVAAGAVYVAAVAVLAAAVWAAVHAADANAYTHTRVSACTHIRA